MASGKRGEHLEFCFSIWPVRAWTRRTRSCVRSKGTIVHALSVSSVRQQSRGEEIANSISHGLALVAALVGTPYLLIHAVHREDDRVGIGASILAATMIFLYLSSTLYHALPVGKAKRVFRLIEHSAIFLLIAGTYTPFTLGVLRGAWGWTLMGLIWSLAAIGVALKVSNTGQHPVLSTSLYLLMGWLIVIEIG